MTLKSLFIFILLAISSAVNAHKTILSIEDNGNGTVSIKAELSTGGSVAGSNVILKDKSTGQPILKEELPESGELIVKIPEVPYTVTLDQGKGHIVTKTGPLFKYVNDSLLKNNENPSIQKTSPEENIENFQKQTSKSNRLLFLIVIGCVVILLGIITGIVKSKAQ